MSTYTKLDQNQIFQRVFDETEDRLKVDAQVSATLGTVECVITASSGDNIAINDGTNTLKIESDGSLNVNGVSTATKQDVGNSSLSSIDSKIPSNLTVSSSRLLVDNSGITQPVSGTITANQGGTWSVSRSWTLSNITDSIFSFQAGTWDINNISGTISLPTGAATSANQTTANSSLSSIDSKLNTLGQKTMATSAPIVIASDQSAIPVTQSGTWTTGRTWSLLNSTDSVNAVQSGTWNINNISGTISLPTGAATSANQTTANTSLSNIDSSTSSINSKLGTLGQKAMSGSAPVVIASDQSSIPVIQSGTWTVQQGTPPWASNITQFGSVNISTGTGASGTGIPRVTVSNDSNILATQSGTWNINNISGTISLPTGAATSALQTTGNTSLASIDTKTPTQGQKTMANSSPVVIASDQSAVPVSQSGTWTVQQGTPPWSVVGNVASAATDSGNPVKTGGIFNSTLPTFTNGQRADAQADVNGRRIVLSIPSDGYKTTYSATSTFVAAATPTDIFTLTGSASKTIRVLKIGISATQTTSSEVNIILLKRSTANTGGTSTTLTNVSLDSNNAAATATARSYTANPTIGTLVGNLRNIKVVIPVVAIGGNASSQTELVETFGNQFGQALVLRGTGEVFSLNLNSTTVTGNSFSVWIEWIEE